MAVLFPFRRTYFKHMAKPIEKVKTALLSEEELVMLGQLPPSRGTATRREKALSSSLKDVLTTKVDIEQEDGVTYADVLAVKAVARLLEDPNARDLAALAKIIGDVGATEVSVTSASLMDRALDAIAIKRGDEEDGGEEGR